MPGSGCTVLRTGVLYGSVDLRHELLILHRSVVMLRPDERALTRDRALALFEQLEELQAELDRLRTGLRALLEEPG
jgi:hypothetical protein